ncbi:transmembrane protein 272-like [Sparus aurata]|uniref:Transmembrane protein 272-like n=1 Tax=Sparus aurata TaxID=8175 RepID=A0A671VWI8_SPAAU|nr:transmembrane protein 272-like [Sparus aurata]
MEPSPPLGSRPQKAVMISSAVVLNIIWWMVMIAAIFLGATHLDNCPLQPWIPIYLIVLGGASIFALSLTYSTRIWDDGCPGVMSYCCTAFLHFFTFCWIIAGTIWVYPVYPPNYISGDLYCHKTTYLFAFVVTTLVWASMTLVFVCGCCCSCVGVCKAVRAGRRLIPNRYSFYGALSEEPPAGDV